MAAFKIFAGLFVVCFAQDVASARLLPKNDISAENDKTLLQIFGLRENFFASNANHPVVYKVAREFQDLETQFEEVKKTDVLLKAQCDDIKDEVDKEICIKKVNDIYVDRVAILLEKAVPIISKLMSSRKGV